MIPLLHDGDHGGDDVLATLLAAASPAINLLGVTTVAGNASPEQAARNARQTLNYVGFRDVPVATGATRPWKIDYRLGDDVFSADGLGGISIPVDAEGPLRSDGIAFMADTLRAAPAPVTIAATGPLTNIALLLENHPDVKDKIAQLQIMGGGTNPAGNIKPYAEFNFYMDPDAADFVLNAGVPTLLHTLNTTQQMIFGPAEQAVFTAKMAPEHSAWLLPLMRLLEDLEKKSFGVDGTFNHDIQTILALLWPQAYQSVQVTARVDTSDALGGKLLLTESADSVVRVVTHMDAGAAFNGMMDVLTRL